MFRMHQSIFPLLVLANALLSVYAGTLIVSVDDPKLVLLEWEVYSVAGRSWNGTWLSFLDIDLFGGSGFFNAAWYNTYTPEPVEDHEGSWYQFTTAPGFWQNLLGAEMEHNELHFEYLDVNETYTGKFELIPGAENFMAGIRCWKGDESMGLGTSLSCDNPSVNWGNDGEPTMISVSMMNEL